MSSVYKHGASHFVYNSHLSQNQRTLIFTLNFMYGKCSEFLSTFLFFLNFSAWNLASRFFIQYLPKQQTEKTLIRLLWHLLEQSDLSLHCLSRHFSPVTSVQNFRTFTITYVPLGLVGPHINGMQINKGPYSPDLLQAPLPGTLVLLGPETFHAFISIM